MNWKEIAPPTFIYDSKGKWVRNWFSNMIAEDVIIDGVKWNSVENYYQAMKSADKSVQQLFLNINPYEAKKLGREILLRPDWEDSRVEAMKKALICKFTNNANNRSRLLQTEDSILVEWNNWGDRFWGVDVRDFNGKNTLGKLLMEIRSEIRNR